MSYVRGWTAYFADGSIYSSIDTKPTSLPTIGIQIVMLYFTDGTRRIIESNDRVFWFDNGSDDGVWGQTDEPALDIAARYPGAHIMEGSLLSDSTFRSIEIAALTRKEP